jgi:hypothetical protein
MELNRVANEHSAKRKADAIVAMIERVQEENERLREESLEIRSLLASQFERQTASSRDSGLWSGNNSDDGQSVAHSDLDEQIAQDRLTRHLRQLLDVANREIAERDEEIMRLEAKIVGSQAPDDVSDNSGASSASQYCIGNLVQQNLVRHYFSKTLRVFFFPLSCIPSFARNSLFPAFTAIFPLVNAGVLFYFAYRCLT